MSMLAEPRRKKAWVLNPKGSRWAEDDSKFGQKMLEQMGWSKGRGLGRTMDGITEHIRPSVQNDSRGLGYEGNADDWVAHLDDFNDVLAKLQGDQAGESQTASAAPKSLEERSKKSRARVHYHKFTRGKDLSRASSQDLACILGGRADAAASQPVTPVSSRPPSPPQHADSEPETERAPQTRTEVDSNGYTTIVTGKSCKDYFAEKMRKMNMLKIKHQQDGGRVSSDPDCTGPGDSSAQEEISAEPEKSSLLRPSYLNRETVSLNVYAPPAAENPPASKKTKKKKRRTPENLDTASSSMEIEDPFPVLEPKRKKKKSKNDTVLDPKKPSKETQKGKGYSDDTELGNYGQIEGGDVENSAAEKNGSSNKRKIADTEEESSAIVTQNPEKKKKKKKSKTAV